MKTSASAKKSKSTKAAASSSAKTEKAAKTSTKAVKAEKMEKAVVTETPIVEAVTEKPAAKKPADKFRRFFLWNVWLAVVYGVQGTALLLLSDTKTAPVTSEFLSQDKLASSLADKPVFATASQHLFDINLAQLLAAALFVIALTHVLAATVLRKRYEGSLDRGVNKLRWIGNALSGGAFVMLIALLLGVTNASTLAMLFTLAALSFVAALVAGLFARQGAKSRFLCGIGVIAGLVPGLVIGLLLLGATIWGDSAIPAYLYWLVGSATVIAFTLAAITYAQYKKTGKWADYLYGERVFLIVSLLANTALAWQIFAGALRS